MMNHREAKYHNQTELMNLLQDHHALNYLRNAEHMRLVHCTLHVRRDMLAQVWDIADRKGISRNGMFVEIVLGYLTADGDVPSLRHDLLSEPEDIIQWNFRLPAPVIQHLRWLGSRCGLSMSEIVMNAMVFHFDRENRNYIRQWLGHDR